MGIKEDLKNSVKKILNSPAKNIEDDKYHGCNDEMCVKLLMSEPEVKKFKPSQNAVRYAFYDWQDSFVTH